MPKISVADLKFGYPHNPKNLERGYSNVYRQAYLFSGNRPSSEAHLPAMRQPVPGQPESQKLYLPRSVSMHGFCSTHIQRKSSGHRSMFASSANKTLSHGHSWWNCPKYPRKCKQNQRLANLCGLGAISHHYRPRTLYRRRSRDRVRQYRFALDASTIDLCLSVFPWATFRKTKAAVKLHTLLDLRGNIPTFIHISDAKLHDVNVLDILIPEPGSFYVMDRGYLDFKRLYAMNLAGAFFLIRAKSNTKFKRRYSHKADTSSGVICDQTIVLTGANSSADYPHALRRVKYHDSVSGKIFNFLTNNFTLSAQAVADLYRQRWQVELFFKWIKQHLRIKAFYGTSENAVKTQIWIAVSVYVLIAIIKKRLGIKENLYTILQVLSVTVFEKIPLIHAVTGSGYSSKKPQQPNQLKLFD